MRCAVLRPCVVSGPWIEKKGFMSTLLEYVTLSLLPLRWRRAVGEFIRAGVPAGELLDRLATEQQDGKAVIVEAASRASNVAARATGDSATATTGKKGNNRRNMNKTEPFEGESGRGVSIIHLCVDCYNKSSSTIRQTSL